MKTKNILLTGILAIAGLSSCNDFAEINEDPNLVGEDKVKPEWFLNASVIGAQMNPEIAERMFILTWNRASRFNRGSGFTLGTDNNDYITLYLSNDYAVNWLNDVTKAIELGEKKIAEGEAGQYPYYKNVVQMARIWRAYLNSEVADGFGPIPALSAFSGVPAPYDSVESIYGFILSELKEAEAALDPSIDMSPMANEDAFYAGNVNAWKKYANSLRLRFAMRVSDVYPEARAEFEDAASKSFISEQADIASVPEKDGWDELTSVMSRPWNGQAMSVTFKNLVVGLGGIEFPLPDSLKSHLKNPHDYLGLYLNLHFPLTTNDPCAGFYFDGIPQYVDPRAPKMFSVVGYDDGVVYSDYIGAASEVTPVGLLNPDNTTETMLTINPKYTWTTWVAGEWDTKAGLVSSLTGKNYNYPSIAKQYRMSTNKRVFFGPWESYFLLAEAAVKGWNVPGTAKSNYEQGVTASFTYHGLANEVSQYLASTDYNRVGTSVNFDHTAEAQPYTINYVDPYTKQNKTMTYTYPKNTIYRNGAYNNDALTKIITQKYIAQVPWLPEEAWSDHRRLGLPFFENQAVEKDYNPLNQVPLTVATSKECRLEFYPKRYRYPANIQTNNQEGYQQALKLLGGPDLTSTSLWWNMK
ncbi:SusD/RagB family nutrient-binding outer membrane lipoprotein [Parabacteroides bouchesdurhonensis]|uniref:SusD/RagB family nutrient-binding outer membrane lipoprotein n=1 Tax=Parabacteroides bouchesdurhonensis TaxID=1936995 RepID=UPI000E48CD89|nr:SusD/RagB family nutrient-binding outer membrane lipoprotein [Parabacteroides bouchesdurhonensis]RHJ90671.1 SusD/RagB family nutrient-binding outer membrane lipoprotein [Bacteroides sp. AM07-16]